MKKLSKKQRNRIYVLAFKKIEGHNEKFICNALGIRSSLLPEFEMFFPNNYYVSDPFSQTYYNNGEEVHDNFQGVRLTILQFCIEMTK